MQSLIHSHVREKLWVTWGSPTCDWHLNWGWRQSCETKPLSCGVSTNSRQWVSELLGVENSHIWHQKCCECGNSMRVKENQGVCPSNYPKWGQSTVYVGPIPGKAQYNTLVSHLGACFPTFLLILFPRLGVVSVSLSLQRIPSNTALFCIKNPGSVHHCTPLSQRHTPTLSP